MAFTKKTWVDRDTEYPTRRKLNIISSSASEMVATVERYEGEVTQAGDAFNATNMNGLEGRIETEANNIEGMIGVIQNGNTASSDVLVEGKYFVHKGKFYLATQSIPSGGAITPGRNCDEKRIGNVLTKLESAFNSLKSAVNSQIFSLTKSLNNVATTANQTLSYHGAEIADMKTLYMPVCHITFNNTNVTGGSVNLPAKDVSAYIRNSVVRGVLVTAVGANQAEVWGGTIIDSSNTNCIVHCVNLSNPSFSGRVNLEVIYFGR